MTADLRISLLQQDLVWENPDENREIFGPLISSLAGKTDLIILPEMFTTGFTMDAQNCSESMAGETVQWMRQHARSADCDIAGSIIIREQSTFLNRMIWVKASGDILFYDKKHLFRYAGEDDVYTAGQTKLVVELNGWQIRPFVCYDLRFPIWNANCRKEYDLAVYVANWPQARDYHWRSLLTARAIENQVYVAGVNRVGVDGNGIQYEGASTVLDPKGHILHQCGGGKEAVTVRLDREFLESYRLSFPAWKDMEN